MNTKTVVMFGATGAVGNHCALALNRMPEVEKLTLLGRRAVDNIQGDKVEQETIDIFDTESYREFLVGHNTAICTLGVGEPSKMAKKEFIKIDKDAVLDFATACKKAGVEHFELLSSIGTNARSLNYYFRTKGELEQELEVLNFKRLSLFHPSTILTPENRYGVSQAIALSVTRAINPFLLGSAKRYRGIDVDTLGQSIAANLTFNTDLEGIEVLHWQEFNDLCE